MQTHLQMTCLYSPIVEQYWTSAGIFGFLTNQALRLAPLPSGLDIMHGRCRLYRLRDHIAGQATAAACCTNCPKARKSKCCLSNRYVNCSMHLLQASWILSASRSPTFTMPSLRSYLSIHSRPRTRLLTRIMRSFPSKCQHKHPWERCTILEEPSWICGEWTQALDCFTTGSPPILHIHSTLGCILCRNIPSSQMLPFHGTVSSHTPQGGQRARASGPPPAPPSAARLQALSRMYAWSTSPRTAGPLASN